LSIANVGIISFGDRWRNFGQARLTDTVSTVNLRTNSLIVEQNSKLRKDCVYFFTLASPDKRLSMVSCARNNNR
jgi:hypothetical protein